MVSICNGRQKDHKHYLSTRLCMESQQIPVGYVHYILKNVEFIYLAGEGKKMGEPAREPLLM